MSKYVVFTNAEGLPFKEPFNYEIIKRS